MSCLLLTSMILVLAQAQGDSSPALSSECSYLSSCKNQINAMNTCKSPKSDSEAEKQEYLNCLCAPVTEW